VITPTEADLRTLTPVDAAALTAGPARP